MNRRQFITVLCAAAMVSGMAQAASFEDSVVAQLRSQGYKAIVTERTLLGRIKISATRNGGRREIILNPRTGEVLRDLWIAAGGGGSVPSIIGDNDDRSGGGGDDNGDDNGDDSDDDSGDDSDDDSDSGGSSSGSGGSGGGDDGGGDDDDDD